MEPMDVPDTAIWITLGDADMREINNPEPKPFVLECGHDASEWLQHTVNMSVWYAVLGQ